VPMAPEPLPPAMGPPVRAGMDGDTDIVGSIPIAPAGEAEHPVKPAQHAFACPLDFLPGVDKAKQELACGGARHNRWTARLQHFNYDLSGVDPHSLDIFLPRIATPQQAP
jgi:hypothetical protein